MPKKTRLEQDSEAGGGGGEGRGQKWALFLLCGFARGVAAGGPEEAACRSVPHI